MKEQDYIASMIAVSTIPLQLEKKDVLEYLKVKYPKLKEILIKNYTDFLTRDINPLVLGASISQMEEEDKENLNEYVNSIIQTYDEIEIKELGSVYKKR